jgi:prephenate dehydrogenase
MMPIRKKMKKQKISIIGVGLLGGSLALALKKRKAFQLVGWNHRPSSRRKAAKLLPVASTFEQAVEGAEVVVLCSHSSSITPVLKQLTTLVDPQVLIMDVSSVKGRVAEEAGRLPGMAWHFVPCHPMAGKEKSGPANADANLYRGRTVFITPLPQNPASLVRRAKHFWKSVGAIPVVLDAKTHDRAVALTSHLPHLLASALMNTYEPKQRGSHSFRPAVGSGFRDFTRIAAGNPAMWTDIMEMNAVEIKSFLSQFRRTLGQLEKNLTTGKRNFWISFFEKARASREKL